MALKGRRYDKTWKKVYNFYFIFILSGLLYLILFATSEPVCYTRISLDERRSHIKRVDCDGTDEICMQFASSKAITLEDLLNSPCRYPLTHEKDTEDIDECSLGTDDCEVLATCGNTAGSYTCTCQSGYQGDGTNSGTGCSDIDECTEGTDNCLNSSSNGRCINYGGGFTCQCLTGYSGNGITACIECNEWNQWNGSEYKFFSTRLTWNESRQLCESSSSHLVTIESKEENEFVHKMMHHCDGYSYAWIGLNDIDAEDTWEWSDGTVLTYRNWYKGQPDGQDCVSMYPGDGTWRDYWCWRVCQAVCERNNTLT